jgi:crotonobetainyl-CoA:carnitine CoA-transferase CaiB-like acyl-CoA transferase
MGAFALSAALFQRERTGEGQRVDMAMLDVAMILMASHVTGYLRNGKHPKPSGNRMPHATSMAYQTAEGIIMLGASNFRQQKRLWTVLERPDLIKRTNDERDIDHDREVQALTELMPTRTAAEWEAFLQDGLLHRHDSAPGVPGAFTVPVTAFKFGHDGPRVDRPPPLFGQHNEEVLTELGYSPCDIAGFRSTKII